MLVVGLCGKLSHLSFPLLPPSVHHMQTLFYKEADRLEQATASDSTCILT